VAVLVSLAKTATTATLSFTDSIEHGKNMWI